MREDRAYLEVVTQRLQSDGLTVSPVLSEGDPPREILKLARSSGCDLIAMTTHGHRFVQDFLLGSTIEKVRHESDVPLLLVRAGPRKE
jgi:manganese transport protein